ncbi:hypothetical protein L3X38_041558 [Prunus dulcis]|uniref:Uncharacterized protein n=1 Tax=Prunus dulcis TaxID=3755 RepID=A0AAD4YKH4_PRUDU|nr:hypothetical protein L3X38_041558 [Prunus dulcis]
MLMGSLAVCMAKTGIVEVTAWIRVALPAEERTLLFQEASLACTLYAREREYLPKKDMDKTDRETMAMDTSHMSPETKQFWKLERRDVMRRILFRDDGPSNTDWLNDGNH